MEGLIPFVYRSLKKSQTRRKYECLSSGAAAPYNISDFYVKDDDREYFSGRGYSMLGPNDVSGHRGAQHRRSSSVAIDGRHVHDAGGFALEGGVPPSKKKQLIRFRSHRMLSCITGA